MKDEDRLVVSDIDTPVSRFYIINALGEYLFIRCRSRKKAQEIIDKEYGKSFYTVRTIGIVGKHSDNYTARV